MDPNKGRQLPALDLLSLGTYLRGGTGIYHCRECNDSPTAASSSSQGINYSPSTMEPNKGRQLPALDLPSLSTYLRGGIGI
ncbi:hypothetical protein AVEN_57224-1 [Araneus ventricosus]|uniref:Uncharacterized protein n=1 Tax=Araneus ventricosus TaxID=182803 RepID=A0A4Y2JCB3_ARAVE|nr:hypothetical protein AVEN_57224-1 [Araneus ventricosus]